MAKDLFYCERTKKDPNMSHDIKFLPATQAELRDYEHKCLVCCDRAVEVNEIITRKAYGGWRAKDGWSQVGNQWPMCRKHHDEFHHGRETFAKKYGLEKELEYAKVLFYNALTARKPCQPL
jgi:hypothetical protein